MRSTTLALALALVLPAGCTEAVTPPEPLGDYTTWAKLETYGPAPGHGDTYRIIYINETARRMGTSTVGATLVKEVRDNDAGAPGDLRVIEIMRKVRGGISTEDEGGWLFTATDAPGGDETHTDTCWNRCHVAAPLSGVWFDYTRVPAPPTP